MNAGLAQHIETGAERGASAVFAGAIGFAVYGAFGEAPLQPELGLGIGVAAVIAYFLSKSALETVAERDRSFVLRVFDVRDIEAMDDELVLTDAERIDDDLVLTDAERIDDDLVLTEADRLHPGELVLTEADQVIRADQPLELDDILHELQPDSRVVRLFDRKAMPTPGQLKQRIDTHLEQAPARPLSDASQALSDALAELRRSLR
jgi:hypothetical protein